MQDFDSAVAKRFAIQLTAAANKIIEAGDLNLAIALAQCKGKLTADESANTRNQNSHKVRSAVRLFGVFIPRRNAEAIPIGIMRSHFPQVATARNVIADGRLAEASKVLRRSRASELNERVIKATFIGAVQEGRRFCRGAILIKAEAA
jgi:hypothetical protein